MKVLVAEGEVMVRKLLDYPLRKHGYETVMACDGEEALELLGAISDVILVVLDIIMPKLDGVGRLIRNSLPTPSWLARPFRLRSMAGCARCLPPLH
ncbi:MAG: response regulator [Dehalococcoidia bacterium]